MRSRLKVSGVLGVIVAASVIVPATGASSGSHADEERRVTDVEFLGEVVVPTGTQFAGTEIGGLSSITYDAARGVYHAVSDDQGNRPTGDPVRYYTLLRNAFLLHGLESSQLAAARRSEKCREWRADRGEVGLPSCLP